MGNHTSNLLRLIVIGCALSASLNLPVQAAGGVVVLTRDVHTRQGTRPNLPDPNPTTVNTNASNRVLSQTNELSDGDFASVSTGSMVNRVLMPSNGGTIRGMDAVPSRLPGLTGGSGAGAASGSSIGNRVNQSVQRGLAPLQNLGGSR